MKLIFPSLISIIILSNSSIKASDDKPFDPRKSSFSHFYLEDHFITAPHAIDQAPVKYPSSQGGWNECHPTEFNTKLHDEYARAKNKKAYLQILENNQCITPSICPPTKRLKTQTTPIAPGLSCTSKQQTKPRTFTASQAACASSATLNQKPIESHNIYQQDRDNSYRSTLLQLIAQDKALNDALNNLNFNNNTSPHVYIINPQSITENLNSDIIISPTMKSKPELSTVTPLQPSLKCNMQSGSKIDSKK